jgi:hypothetical protein
VILWKAHVQARTLATSFLEIREHSEEAFDGLFNRACTIANKNKITINKPRTSGRQRRRANAAAETVEQHFRINIFIPLVDHIIKHLNERFPDDIKPMLYGFYLLPWYFRNLTDDIVGSIVDEYQNDIPYPDDLPQEVSRWKTLTSIKEIGSKCTIEQAITHYAVLSKYKTNTIASVSIVCRVL